MSEETPQSKKAARKSVRKKVAKKASAKKVSAKKESESVVAEVAEGALQSQSADHVNAAASTEDATEKSASKSRPPKNKVRDARTEKGEQSVSLNESVEKLIPDSDDQPEAGSSTDNQGKSQEREGQEPGERRGRNRNRRARGERRDESARPPVDFKQLKKKAWQIFASEVTEEGLALLDDNGLREYARSSFNAARLFLEESGRVEGRHQDHQKRQQQQRTDSE
jgi:hypothetical protein